MSKEFNENWNKKTNVTTEWNLSTLDYASNLPTESGLYLVIRNNEFEILPFFMEGDAFEEAVVEPFGVRKKISATENSFYKKVKEIYPYEKVRVTAWAKLPKNADDFMYVFKKGEENDSRN